MEPVSSTPLDPSAACFQPTTVAAGCGQLLPVLTTTPTTFYDPRAVFYLGQLLDSSPPPPACLPHELFAHPPPFSPEFLHAPPMVSTSGGFFWYYPLLLSPPAPPPFSYPMNFEAPRVDEPAVLKKQMSSFRVKKMWIPKKGLIRNAQRQISKKAMVEAQAKLKGQTTLMIRNIPNQLERENLQRLLDDHCMVENTTGGTQRGFCRSAYDFLYLPMDFVFKLNLGYAFVNFTTAEAAARFFIRVNNFEWTHEEKTKICEICPADYQGKHAMRKRFKRSVFECDSEEFLPAVYSPPRDGSVRSRPMTLGRCTGRLPARNRGSMVMTWRKMCCS